MGTARHMNPSTNALLTDLHELTMVQAYLEQKMDQPAVFECFVRKLPARRNVLLAAGLEQVLDYLSELRGTQEDLTWLDQSKRFRSSFLPYLDALRFTGDVERMPDFPQRADPQNRRTASTSSAC